MKKKILSVVLLATSLIVHGEDIFKSKSKQPKFSTQKLKEELAVSLDQLLARSSSSIKQLADLVDEVSVKVKQLLGAQDGTWSKADKKALLHYQHNVNDLLLLLDGLDGKLHIVE